MIALRKERTAWFDVDSTLIFPSPEYPSEEPISYITVGGRKWWPNYPLIEEIKLHKARGQGVVVWSQGGAKWAEDVVVALGLESLVDVVCGKPDWYFDDKDVTEWMGKRFYSKPVRKEKA